VFSTVKSLHGERHKQGDSDESDHERSEFTSVQDSSLTPQALQLRPVIGEYFVGAYRRIGDTHENTLSFRDNVLGSSLKTIKTEPSGRLNGLENN
jgi:hypothetical protein